MTVRVFSLGDSFSCGEGVGVRVPLAQTWVSILADGLVGGCLRPLAAPGAVVADVRAKQLPVALAAAPEVATVLVGLNDVIRAGFDGPRVLADLCAVVAGLRTNDTTVIVVRLHDPVALLSLPGSLRRAVGDRIAVINLAVEEAASADAGVHVLDLRGLPALRCRTTWAVDRLHPSLLGHHAIATAALDLLNRGGFVVERPVTGAPEVRSVRTRDELRWLVRHGLPWLTAHGRQVALPAAGMALRRAGLGISGC